MTWCKKSGCRQRGISMNSLPHEFHDCDVCKAQICSKCVQKHRAALESEWDDTDDTNGYKKRRCECLKCSRCEGTEDCCTSIDEGDIQPNVVILDRPSNHRAKCWDLELERRLGLI